MEVKRQNLDRYSNPRHELMAPAHRGGASGMASMAMAIALLRVLWPLMALAIALLRVLWPLMALDIALLRVLWPLMALDIALFCITYCLHEPEYTKLFLRLNFQQFV